MGIIFNGMAAGFGQGLTGVGQIMAQDAMARQRAQEADAQARLRYQEAADLRLSLLDRQEAGRNARAGTKAAGRGGAGDSDLAPVEGSMSEEALAARLGMSTPELRAFRKLQATGDASAYRPEQELAGPTPDGSKLTGKGDLPPGFDAWVAQKRSQLGGALEERAYGKDYKEVTEGRATEIGNPTRAGIVNGTIAAPKGAERLAAAKGEGAFKNAKTNEFTGEASDTTRLDLASEERVAGKKLEATTGEASTEAIRSLTRESVSADGAVKQSMDRLKALEGRLKDTSSKDKPELLDAIKAEQATLGEARVRRDDVTRRLSQLSTGRRDQPAKAGDGGGSGERRPADPRRTDTPGGPVDSRNDPNRFVRPADQAASDRDAGSIIQKELAKAQIKRESAKTPEEAARLDSDISSLKAELARLGKKSGVPQEAKNGDNGIVKSAAQAAPKLQELPPGAKQIGTSGGRPVYQLPNGRKVIQQ